jgi:predicted nucleotidyltransferase
MITIEEIKLIVVPLVAPYPIRRVILFGSYARGEAGEKSDVDLIIDSGGRLNAFDYFGIIGDIVKAMPVKVDVFELDEVKKPSKMFDSITNEGVVIYEA